MASAGTDRQRAKAINSAERIVKRGLGPGSGCISLWSYESLTLPLGIHCVELEDMARIHLSTSLASARNLLCVASD